MLYFSFFNSSAYLLFDDYYVNYKIKFDICLKFILLKASNCTHVGKMQIELQLAVVRSGLAVVLASIGRYSMMSNLYLLSTNF